MLSALLVAALQDHWAFKPLSPPEPRSDHRITRCRPKASGVHPRKQKMDAIRGYLPAVREDVSRVVATGDHARGVAKYQPDNQSQLTAAVNPPLIPGRNHLDVRRIDLLTVRTADIGNTTGPFEHPGEEPLGYRASSVDTGHGLPPHQALQLSEGASIVGQAACAKKAGRKG